MSSYFYEDYVITLNKRFEQALEQVKGVSNFELGPDFEVKLCEVLRDILPQKYGICRGYVVNRQSDPAGDDIIIYDRLRFPTLRLTEENKFAQKEHVPSEAVYAYIEAKHSLVLEGDGHQSLTKAVTQVSAVKRLCETRPPFRNRIDLSIQHRCEPVLGVIISRFVRIKDKGNLVDDSAEIHSRLSSFDFSNVSPPDLIIAGKNNIMVPAIPDEKSNAISETIMSCFTAPAKSRLFPYQVNGIAFGTGVAAIMWAIERIELGEMHWPPIVIQALGLPYG